MRSFTTLLLAFAASASAYQVSAPGASQNWSINAQNYLVWQRVDTDPLNFTAVLTNTNRAIMPLNNQVLDALVDGTLGRIVCNPPSAGWPTGDGFRVNLAKDAQSLDSLLAQSNEFSITTASSSGSTTSTLSTIGLTTTAPTTTEPSTTTTSSLTNTSPTSTNAAAFGMNMQAGLLALIAMLGAIVI